MLNFLLLNVKMPTIVGILTFMSRNIFMLTEVSMNQLSMKFFSSPEPKAPGELIV